METLLLYLGKVIFTSAILFFYYKLFLKDKTFHHYNRFYLLSIVIISICLPLLKVGYFTLEINNSNYLLINNLQNFNFSNQLHYDFPYLKIVTAVIGLVAVFFLSKLIFGLVKIQLLKKKFLEENFEGISFYQTNLQEAPFSYFKNLFWKQSIAIDSEVGRQILKHEMVHIEQKHSWDKIFIEILTSLFWFNPVFYLIKKELYLIHEYLADKKALKNSDSKAFAQMLLASHFSGMSLPATSPFLSSNLKKRLTMLKKSNTKFSYARKILVLPLLFTIAFVYLVNAKNKEIVKSNSEIESLLSTLKMDTLKSNGTQTKEIPEDIAYGTNATKLYEEHAELFIDNDTINKEAEKKFNSPEFQQKMKAVELKIKDVERKFNSPEFQQKMKAAELKFKEAERKFNSPEYQQKIKAAELKFKEAEKKFNSPEYQKKIKAAELKFKEAEKKFNSPEYQQKIKAAELKFKEAEKKFNSPEYQRKIKAAELKFKEAEKKFNSPEYQQKIKAAELKFKEAEKKLKYSEFKLNLDNSEIIAVESAQYKSNSGKEFKDNVKIFIGEIASTREEMQKLNQNTIESVNVYKKGFEGKENDEIHIKLKK